MTPESEDRQHVVRRDFLRLIGGGVAMLVTGDALSGCGGGGGNAGGGSSGVSSSQQGRFIIYTGTDVVGKDNGASVTRLATILNVTPGQEFINGGFNNPPPSAKVPTSAVVWGVRDSLGNPSRITQAVTWTTDPTKSVRTWFDSSGRVVQIRNEATGELLTIAWQATGQDVAIVYYNAAGVAGGGSWASAANNTAGYTVSPLPPSRSVSRVITHSNAHQALQRGTLTHASRQSDNPFLDAFANAAENTISDTTFWLEELFIAVAGGLVVGGVVTAIAAVTVVAIGYCALKYLAQQISSDVQQSATGGSTQETWSQSADSAVGATGAAATSYSAVPILTAAPATSIAFTAIPSQQAVGQSRTFSVYAMGAGGLLVGMSTGDITISVNPPTGVATYDTASSTLTTTGVGQVTITARQQSTGNTASTTITVAPSAVGTYVGYSRTNNSLAEVSLTKIVVRTVSPAVPQVQFAYFGYLGGDPAIRNSGTQQNGETFTLAFPQTTFTQMSITVNLSTGAYTGTWPGNAQFAGAALAGTELPVTAGMNQFTGVWAVGGGINGAGLVKDYAWIYIGGDGSVVGGTQQVDNSGYYASGTCSAAGDLNVTMTAFQNGQPNGPIAAQYTIVGKIGTTKTGSITSGGDVYGQATVTQTVPMETSHATTSIYSLAGSWADPG